MIVGVSKLKNEIADMNIIKIIVFIATIPFHHYCYHEMKLFNHK